MYEKVQHENVQYEKVKDEFDHQKFRNDFTKCNGNKRSLRKYIMFNTDLLLLKGSYMKNNKKIIIPNSSFDKVKYYSNKKSYIPKYSIYNNTPIFVECKDSIDLALEMKNTNLNPCVLVNASKIKPGGGCYSGAIAQEEDICRRTNLYWYLVNGEHYPIPDFGGIYSPNVTIIRSNENCGFELLDNPEQLSFINVHAYKIPKKVKSLNNNIRYNTKIKIRKIFEIALENNHDSLCLSALGCGVFNNPPKDIAQLFLEVIEEYNGCFKEIRFAILSKSSNINFMIFKEILEKSLYRESNPKLKSRNRVFFR